MKITLRALCQQDIKGMIARDRELSKFIDSESLVYVFDSDSNLFEVFLEKTKNSLGCWFNPYMEFNEDEIADVRHYQLQCRGKVLKPSKKDEQINHETMKRAEFIYTGEKIKIQLMPEIAISKIDLKTNMIGCASEWLDEYVLPDMVVKKFNEADLSGFAVRPIFNPRSDDYHAGYHHLFSDNLMPSAEMDITTIRNRIERVEEEEYSFRRLGCLIYKFKAINKIMDFNRTAENWSSNYFPTWIVSSNTKKCYEQNKLKGWTFYPVLDVESDLYKQYSQKWKLLFKKVKINPRNKID